MKTFFILGLMISTCALANESGYLQNGDAHVVYRDGKKVGEWPAKKRKPASMANTAGDGYGNIRFDDDGVVRCYTVLETNDNDDVIALSCVKKQ